MVANTGKKPPKNPPDKCFQTLARTDTIHNERNISKGHTSPEKGWYEQYQNECVLLLKDAARLAFEDGSEASTKLTPAAGSLPYTAATGG